MEWKEEKEKMRILNPGNREGFSIVEASVSLFVAGVLLFAIISFVRTTSKYTQKLINRVDSYIQYQNEYTEKSM